MKYFIFDTETTGLDRMKDEVIELGGILLDEKFSVEKVVHFYCSVDKVIPKQAVNIHGIDNGKLMKLSNNLFFEDYMLKAENNFITKPKDIFFIGYNVSYDINMVNNSLGNNGYDTLDFGRNTTSLNHTEGIYNLDLMRAVSSLLGTRGFIKLKDAVTRICKVNEEQLNEMFNTFCKERDISANAGYHGALFDTYCTTMLLANTYKYFL